MPLPRKSFASKPRKALAPMSAKRRERLAEQGIAFPSSTLISNMPLKAKRSNTGPKRDERDLLHWRSSGLCEWPAPLCPELATDAHHRLNRKLGGRHGEMRDRLNGVEWLLHACRTHHAYVTSPYGHRRRNAIAIGWLLLEGQDALRVPVLTRHHDEPVWLLPDGSWLRFEEACV